MFKPEECGKNWEDLNEIGEQRIEQLTNQLTETQSQNKLLFSQLHQLEQEALRAQSETVAQHSELEELFSVKESNKTLSLQKDTLLAEKTALKNELARGRRESTTC